MQEIAVCGHGGTKEYLTRLLAASALLDGPYSRMNMLMPNIKTYRDVPELMPKREQGRNEKCNCGSGLKYKKCCGK